MAGLRTTDFRVLPSKAYDVVYADPPWTYYGDPNKDQAAGKHYSCSSYQELAELPVANLLRPRAVVLMWATSSKLSEACSLFSEWGCFYRGVFQVWIKTTNAGKIIHGQGVRPSFTKPTSEYLLVGSTTVKGRTLPIRTEKMPQVVLAPRPGNVHSKKPVIFRMNIRRLFGLEARYLELFARSVGPHWDAWGNEVVGT